MLGKFLYGALFVVMWPAILVICALRIDASGFVTWPVPIDPILAFALFAAGAAIMMAGWIALVRLGGGLPMNAYPTTGYVTGAVYGWMAHPIYVGFGMLAFGAAALAGSPAGFWYVAPMACLASAALVLGYEAPALAARFGTIASRRILGLPEESGFAVPLWQRAWLCIATLGSWAVLYTLFATAPTPSGAIIWRSLLDIGLPSHAGAVWVYSAAYGYAVIGPMLLGDATSLRRFFRAAWIATVLGFSTMLLLPGVHAFAPNAFNGVTGELMGWNAYVDAPWLALPSFHVAWTVLASSCLALRWPRLAWLWHGVSLAVAFACLSLDAHAILDVLAGWLLALVAWHHAAIWRQAQSACEGLANSISSVAIGPFRIFSHAIWSALAAGVGTAVVLGFAGTAVAPHFLLFLTISVVAAALWGYLIEAQDKTARPFGYFGFCIGAALCLGTFWAMDARGAALAAAIAIAAPIAQAIGRLRCIVQGCCHGRPTGGGTHGIRVWNPTSRVVSQAGFACTPIYPTQLYSIAANLALFVIQLRLGQLSAPVGMIIGNYLMLQSVMRFVEERFRGEPRTPCWAQLNLYQWLSLAQFAFGLAFLANPGVPMSTAIGADMPILPYALLAAVLLAFAMSTDMPKAGWRFSRLAK